MQLGPVSTSPTSTAVGRQGAPRIAQQENFEVPDSMEFSPRPNPPTSLLPSALAFQRSAPRPVSDSPAAESPAAGAKIDLSGPNFDPENLDRATSPTSDFYQFAMGGYLAKKPIPADRGRFGIDTEITIANETTIKEILLELASTESRPRGSIEQKLGDFFKSGMNTMAIEKAGLAPLRADLDRIEAIDSPQRLRDEVATMHAEGNGVYFSFYGSTDAKDANATIGEFSQGGLSLPEPAYYTDSENKETLAAYQQHVARTFILAGSSPDQAQREAQSVVDLETKLAAISLSTVEMRDPEALYNKKTPDELQRLSQAMDWGVYLSSQKAEGQATYNVTAPKFLEKLGAIMEDTPMSDHKAYLRWHLLSSNASALPNAFEQESFSFFGKTLRGLEEQAPRIQRVADQTDAILGEALGQKFVERRFSPEAKSKMLEMVDNFKAALADKIAGLSWMSPQTKEGALEKLGTFRAKIGYPDNPQDYASLDIGTSYIDNVRASGRYQRERNMAQIGKPVDREEWGMTASTNNAYYSPSSNEICFPAGILQPPYFDLAADDAMNFGAIGATIGHELGHGFDDEGAQFDAQGNLRNWFTEEDLARFQAKAEGVEKQFSEYMVEGLQVDGKLVLGEALADLSGLELAYAAYKKATEGKTPELIDGFTPDQRFFLSFAQSWATNVRPETAKLMVKSDPHPLPKLRVNGTVSNMPEFFEAFGVRPGQPMRRPEEKRNAIWN